MGAMRSLAGLLLLVASAASCRLPRMYGEDVAVRVQGLYGFQEVDVARLDGHAIAGLEVVTEDPHNSWGYEIGAQYGHESEETPQRRHEAEFNELYVGMRRGWTRGAMHPYFGLGASWARVENTLRTSGPTVEFDDDSGGAYVRGGLLWSLGRYDFDRGTEILMGIDARGLVGDDFDMAQIALVLAFGT